MHFTFKTLLLTFPAILFSQLYCFGQDDNRNKFAKLYSNLSLYSESERWNSTTTANQTDLRIYFTPAVAFFTDDLNFHEIEFTKANFNNFKRDMLLIDSAGNIDVSTDKITELFISLRYEYNFRLFRKNDNTPLKTYIGIGINPYYSYFAYRPERSFALPRYRNVISANFYLVTRLNYDLNEKFFLDLNIPFNIVAAGFNSVKIDNPAWPVQQRTTTTITTELIPYDFVVKFGVGARI